VWKRTVGGQVLHFYLAGINNQNFLMRDRETGTWWQQISGKAIFGKLKGETLELAPFDELSFGLWKKESPGGQVLAPVARDQKKYDSKWEDEVLKLPVPVNFPGTSLKSRDVVVGLVVAGEARAYPVEAIVKQSPIQDRLGGKPILLVVGTDGKSVRAFLSRVDGADIELFRKSDSQEFALIDSEGSGEWSFRGCAVSGPLMGKCLPELPAIKDYWFDWRNYHADTTIYRH
jgi:Protein of unknown function (DUF3179)